MKKIVDPDQLTSVLMKPVNPNPQSHCLPMITLVNVNTSEVTLPQFRTGVLQKKAPVTVKLQKCVGFGD